MDNLLLEPFSKITQEKVGELRYWKRKPAGDGGMVRPPSKDMFEEISEEEYNKLVKEHDSPNNSSF